MILDMREVCYFAYENKFKTPCDYRNKDIMHDWFFILRDVVEGRRKYLEGYEEIKDGSYGWSEDFYKEMNYDRYTVEKVLELDKDNLFYNTLKLIFDRYNFDNLSLLDVRNKIGKQVEMDYEDKLTLERNIKESQLLLRKD